MDFYLVITVRKRSLGQGNVFTPVCHSVHMGGSLSYHASQVTWQEGSLSRGVTVQRGVSVQEGLCPEGVSVQGVSVQGSLCPEGGSLSRGSLTRGSLSRGGSLPRGSLSRGSLSRGSLSRGLCKGDRDTPCTVTSGQYSSYWNAFLFKTCLFRDQRIF